MKDLFLCLLEKLNQHGKLTEALMYKGETFSQVTVENETGTYQISISKIENEGKENEKI